eukprot:876679-Amorphochlora_amoeboformis.AAC.1
MCDESDLSRDPCQQSQESLQKDIAALCRPARCLSLFRCRQERKHRRNERQEEWTDTHNEGFGELCLLKRCLEGILEIIQGFDASRCVRNIDERAKGLVMASANGWWWLCDYWGKVVKGFQRGSKLLGWPTANLDPKAFENKIDHLDQGVFKTALSVGWNPHFKNKEKTVEAYLVNEFKEDFYGTKSAYSN